MRQYSPLQITAPAGTAQATPVSKSWTLYPGWVHSFRIDIPAGHQGLTGVRLMYCGTPVIPFHPTRYLIGNGDTFNVPWEDEIMAWNLSAQAFNTDVFDHTFYLWADVDPYEQLGVVNIRSAVTTRTPSAEHAANIATLGYEGER